MIQPAGFYDCSEAKLLIAGNPKHLESVQKKIDELVRAAGLTLFGSYAERYSNKSIHGYTYLAWIGESAIDIHTWPEYGSVIANVHICNLNSKNEEKLEKLFENFKEFFGSGVPVLPSATRLPLQQKQ